MGLEPVGLICREFMPIVEIGIIEKPSKKSLCVGSQRPPPTVNQAGEWIIVESSGRVLNLVDYFRSWMRSSGGVELPTLFAASVTSVRVGCPLGRLMRCGGINWYDVLR